MGVPCAPSHFISPENATLFQSFKTCLSLQVEYGTEQTASAAFFLHIPATLEAVGVRASVLWALPRSYLQSVPGEKFQLWRVIAAKP